MSNLLTIALVVYLLIGLVVYWVTDTHEAASRIEGMTPLPFGVVQDYLFFFVVALWPIWLWLCSDGPSKRR